MRSRNYFYSLSPLRSPQNYSIISIYTNKSPCEKCSMHDVFLSYSRKDEAIMQRVKSNFVDAGLVVWVDKDSIESDTPSWKRAIKAAILDAGCLVCILSPDAEQSEWVEEELTTAKLHNKPIFLVLANGDEATSIPFGFLNHQRFDIRDNDKYQQEMEKLIAAIGKHLGTDISVNLSTIIGTYTVVDKDSAEFSHDLYGHVGYLMADGSWAVNIRKAKGKGIYGPYLTLKAGKYRAIFHMKIDNNQPSDKPIAKIDAGVHIGSDAMKEPLEERRIMTKDFNESSKYQDFPLEFELMQNTENVEFCLRTESLNAPPRTINLKHVKLEKL